MSSKEALYQPVSSIQVPGYVVDKIGDVPVEPTQTPFQEGFVPDFSRIVTGRRRTKSKPELIQISPTHGRSFELRYTTQGYIFWEDEHKNFYGTLRTKGGNVIDPDVRVEKRAPSGFLIWGIQDSDSIGRTVRASNLMRANHIATEAIVRLVEPAQLQFKGETVSREEYKKRLLDRVFQDNRRDFQEYSHSAAWRPATRKDIPNLVKALNEMTFYLTTSGLQVSERFLDLKGISSIDELQKIMSRVFTFWNAKNRYSSGSVESQLRALDANNLDDIQEYFTVHLPKETAINYARLHNIGQDHPTEDGNFGLLHTYPHLGNVSLVGSIYDVDSVAGAPLDIGDGPVDEEDKNDEIRFLLRGKERFTHADGILNLLKKLQQGIFKSHEEFEDMHGEFARTFALQYIEERGWLENPSEHVDDILDLFRAADIDFLSNSVAGLKAYMDVSLKLGVEDLSKLLRAHALRHYHPPSVIDAEDAPFPVSESSERTIAVSEFTEERKEEIAGLVSRLLILHEAFIASVPREGEDYFKFPKVPDEIKRMHKELQDTDVIDIVRSWASGDLELTKRMPSTPRAIGSFLLTLCQINAIPVADGIKVSLPVKDDPLLISKLKLINEFQELLPHGITKGTWFRQNLADIQGGWGNTLGLENEILKRSAIALFGYGIITRDFNEIFNHHLVEIILNEFSSAQADALLAVYEKPKLADPLQSPANLQTMIKAALTGVAVREGSMEGLLRILGLGDSVSNMSRNLNFLYASEDKNTIEDENVRTLAETKLEEWKLADIARILLLAQKPIHPNSFFADKLIAAELESNDVVELMKIALDMSGDFESMDPTLRTILEEKKPKGLIQNDSVYELVMACIGLDVDLPAFLEPYFKGQRNKNLFMGFLNPTRRSWARRHVNIYKLHEPYPVNPTYQLMSKGLVYLPERIQALLSEARPPKHVIESMAKGILTHLFNDNDGYITSYFGREFRTRVYLEPTIEPKGVFRESWKLVHEDIWNVLRKADPKVLRRYFKGQSTVRIEYNHGAMRGHRDAPLAECLPSDLYERLARKSAPETAPSPALAEKESSKPKVAASMVELSGGVSFGVQVDPDVYTEEEAAYIKNKLTALISEQIAHIETDKDTQ